VGLVIMAQHDVVPLFSNWAKNKKEECARIKCSEWGPKREDIECLRCYNTFIYSSISKYAKGGKQD
jgi:hypothetical protein